MDAGYFNLQGEVRRACTQWALARLDPVALVILVVGIGAVALLALSI